MAKPNTSAKKSGKKKAAKKAAKKTPAKKAAKKAPAKKSPAKKSPAKKTPAKKTPAKKAAAKKTPAVETTPRASEAKAKPPVSEVVLEVGAAAPSFDLSSDAAERHSLVTLADQRVVLYFYPRDNTPGCTIEAKEFSELAPEFEALGVKVLGVSTDSLASHAKFRDKHDLRIGLLSDPEAEAARAYGAWGTKLMYGKPVVGMIRTTFVIDPEGRIEHKYVVRSAAGHAAQVLADLRAQLGAATSADA
jgi:peroxiredoxin Q/BCP